MVRLAQLADDYFRLLALSGRSEQTRLHYRQYVADFLAFLEMHGLPRSAPATKLTRDLVSAYQVDLADRPNPKDPRRRLASATRNLYAAAVRGLLRHGITRLGLDLPAPDTVIVAKVGDRSMRRMEVSDFARLVAALPKGGRDALRDRALLEVLFATGCRLGELVTLTVRRVNLKTREVEVIGKGRKVRGTFLTPEATAWLGRYLATRKDESPYLFVSAQTVRWLRDPKTGERVKRKGVYPFSARGVQELVERLARRAGLPDDFSPHWFRHGRLTIVARHAGLLAAQELAGHASPNTTRRYTRITSAELKRHFDEAERKERAPA